MKTLLLDVTIFRQLLAPVKAASRGLSTVGTASRFAEREPGFLFQSIGGGLGTVSYDRCGEGAWRRATVELKGINLRLRSRLRAKSTGATPRS